MIDSGDGVTHVVQLLKKSLVLEHFLSFMLFFCINMNLLSFLLLRQVPVVDGYSFPHLTKRMNVAGRHITSYLVDLLQRRGWEFFYLKE